jgi:starch phosphorylase
MPTDTPTQDPPLGAGAANRDGIPYTVTAEIHRHLRYTLGTTGAEATPEEMLEAASHAVRNLVLDRLLVTEARQGNSRRVAHIALSHAPGPLLGRSVAAMGLQHAVESALQDVGLSLSDLALRERAPALGDDDPGRATASLLEALATLDLPTTAYGLRFDYGQFRQILVDGRQYELPDEWDADRSPWLVRRASESVWVPVFGRVASEPPAPGERMATWVDWQLLVGVPWDMPVVGHGGRTVQRLRLFAARADVQIDATTFGDGDFQRSVRERLARESVSKLLVPVDDSLSGQERRLLQEYFLVACAVRDVLRVHEQRRLPVTALGETHHVHLEGPAAALTVAELQRAFVDEYRLDWDDAWRLTRSLVTYEASARPAARFPRDVIGRILPRHLQILDVLSGCGTRGTVFVEGALDPTRLGTVGARTTVPSFAAQSHRTWVQPFNEDLARCLTDTLGPGWVRSPERLRDLESIAGRPEIQDRFHRTRTAARIRACGRIQRRTGDTPDPSSLFVVHAAPFRATERPLLAVLDALSAWRHLADGGEAVAPTTWVFAGKAGPDDHADKRVFELIHALSRAIQATPRCRGWLSVHLVPDLDHVLTGSLAACTDLACCLAVPGTGHGSFARIAALHGGHTLGARNATAIEMAQQLGPAGVTLFGPDARTLGERPPRPPGFDDPRIAPAVQALMDGALGDFTDIRHHLLYRDRHHVLADLPSLSEARRRFLREYALRGPGDTITTLARSAGLTSDLAAHRLARGHWHLERC